MRVLMLSQFYKPIIGGEERMVEDLSVELASRGHEVGVATLWHAGLKDYEVDRGVQIFRVRSTTQRAAWLYAEAQRRHAPPWPDPEATLALQHVFNQMQPDIVHAHNWLMYSYLPLKLVHRAGLVVTLHDYSWACATRRLIHQGEPCDGPALMKCLACAGRHYGLLKGVPTVLGQRLMNAIGRPAINMFLPISQAVAAGNGLVGSDMPYRVIPNFMPENTGTDSSDVEPFVSQLPAGDFLLFVGDLSRDKGIHILLQAYAALDDAPPLVLLGRRLPDTPAEFPPNVIFLKSWPHAAVMEAWRRCSVGIVPSTWSEPFGLVTIEAMSCGRPVIASRIGGLSDIVVDGETGLLVPPSDAEALARALRQLLADRDLRERLGQAAQRRSEDFRAATIVPRVEQIYRSIAAKAASTELQGVT